MVKIALFIYLKGTVIGRDRDATGSDLQRPASQGVREFTGAAEQDFLDTLVLEGGL